MDLKFYLSLFLRRLHWFALFLVIGAGGGLALALMLPPVYVAKARLLVEPEQIPESLAASTVQTKASEQIQIIEQRILTRDALLNLAERLEIYGPDTAGSLRDTDQARRVEDMRKRIQIVTTGGMERRGPVRATLVTVSFAAPKADMAARVANELVTLILREDVAMRTRVARETLEFFEQDVARLDQQLGDRGAIILAFREKHQHALPDSLEYRRARQSANQERLLDLERQEAALRDSRARMVRLHEGSGTEGGAAHRQSDEQRQLQLLRDELAAKLSVLSPQNPKVTLLEARIKALQTVVEAQLSRGAAPPKGVPHSPPEAQLAELDGQLEYLATQQERVRASLDELRQSIKATPKNAITLDTFERDYANLRAQYDQAVANKARAQTGDIIEALRQGQRISVIEQALTPIAPESPKRALIAAAGMFGGIALGLGIVVLLIVRDRRVRRPADLTTALGITPFATLPFYHTEQKSKRRHRRLAA